MKTYVRPRPPLQFQLLPEGIFRFNSAHTKKKVAARNPTWHELGRTTGVKANNATGLRQIETFSPNRHTPTILLPPTLGSLSNTRNCNQKTPTKDHVRVKRFVRHCQRCNSHWSCGFSGYARISSVWSVGGRQSKDGKSCLVSTLDALPLALVVCSFALAAHFLKWGNEFHGKRSFPLSGGRDAIRVEGYNLGITFLYGRPRSSSKPCYTL